MDLDAIKRSVIERISRMDDELRLLALKRWADRQDQYFDRDWNVVPPSEAVDNELPLFRVEERNYTADEVRALLDEVRLTFESDEHAPFLSQEEIAELDRQSDDIESGKSPGIPWEEVKARLKGDPPPSP